MVLSDRVSPPPQLAPEGGIADAEVARYRRQSVPLLNPVRHIVLEPQEALPLDGRDDPGPASPFSLSGLRLHCCGLRFRASVAPLTICHIGGTVNRPLYVLWSFGYNWDMNPGERLRLARRRAGLRQRDLAQRIGVARETIRRWETTGRIPARRLPTVAEALGMDLDALGGPQDASNHMATYTDRVARLPLYLLRHSGRPMDTGAGPGDRVEVMPRLAQLADAVIEIDGMDMYPALVPGDWVGISRQDGASPGQWVLVDVDDEPAIMRYEGKGSRRLLLCALNDRKPPDDASAVRILGVCRWLLREARGGRM